MRERERIDRILALIQEIWHYMPDIRFNQLVSALQTFYSQRNGGYGTREVFEKEVTETYTVERKVTYLDFFHLEDDEFEAFLESYAKELREERK